MIKKIIKYRFLVLFFFIGFGMFAVHISTNLQMLRILKKLIHPGPISNQISGELSLDCKPSESFKLRWYDAIVRNDLDNAERALFCLTDPVSQVMTKNILITRYMQQNNVISVKRLCSQLADPNMVWMITDCSDWAWQQGDTDFAILEDEVLLQLTPQDRFLYHKLTNIYSAQGKIGESVRIMQALINYQRANEGIIVEDITLLGSLLDQTGENKLANQIWNEAVSLFPNSETTWQGLASNAILRNDIEETLQLADELIIKFPDSYSSSLKAADIYYRYGRLEKAAELAHRMIESNPDLAGAYFLLGQILVSVDDYISAQNQFTKAVDLAPDKYYYLSTLADLIQKSDPQKAIDLYQRALVLDMPEAEKLQILSKLQSLIN